MFEILPITIKYILKRGVYYFVDDDFILVLIYYNLERKAAKSLFQYNKTNYKIEFLICKNMFFVYFRTNVI